VLRDRATPVTAQPSLASSSMTARPRLRAPNTTALRCLACISLIQSARPARSKPLVSATVAPWTPEWNAILVRLLAIVARITNATTSASAAPIFHSVAVEPHPLLTASTIA
jgi:hypothetical protein